jgi:hypothetical protein
MTRLGDKKLGDYLEHKGRGKRGEYEIACVSERYEKDQGNARGGQWNAPSGAKRM